jgi:hypothetical protein
MTPSTQAASIRHEVTLALIERAFAALTEGFGSFKPREHNLLAVDIAETVFERDAEQSIAAGVCRRRNQRSDRARGR